MKLSELRKLKIGQKVYISNCEFMADGVAVVTKPYGLGLGSIKTHVGITGKSRIKSIAFKMEYYYPCQKERIDLWEFKG